MVAALALAATVAIPVTATAASANLDSPASTPVESAQHDQALTVSSAVHLGTVTRDSSTIARFFRAANPSAPAAGGWTAPIYRPITSPWGPRQVICTAGVGCDSGFHRGDDFGAPCGTPIYAVAAGVVTSITRYGLAGDEITITHGGGISTAYSHMFDSGILVTQGEAVTAGQNIALAGSSGDSTGCHLYFEYRVNGVTVNPQPAMAAHGVILG
ncbi:MAG: hypothetical protein QOI70_1505 [Microbacteriaceae bacterium]|jgi:murein DD-endopeptidase MepM/ murein hydrolase activator NlpD|nr:hypothetical protein [Microbacteriaceae bacterium]